MCSDTSAYRPRNSQRRASLPDRRMDGWIEPWFCPFSVNHHRPDRLALVHQVERIVDAFEWHRVRDEIIDIDLLVHVPVDDPGDVRATARAAERGALPDAAGDELERTRLDLLAGAGHADDDRD